MPTILDDLTPVGTTEIVLDPTEISTDLGVTRTELHLNLGPIVVAPEGIDWGDAVIEQFQAEAMMGQLPAGFRVPNRMITIPLILGAAGRASFASCKANLQAKVALLQREGGWIRRGTGCYAEIVSAAIKIPDHRAHLGIEADVVLSLEALPDFFGDEIELDEISGTGDIAAVLELDGDPAIIDGDYPARVRIVVRDTSGNSQRGLFWALRSRYYDAAATARPVYEAEDLTPVDAAAIATVTGASGGGSNNVVRHASVATSWTPVLATEIDGVGEMTHRGTYRMFARVYSTSATPPRLRLLWDVGDIIHPSENSPWTIPAASQFFIADLGQLHLAAAPTGAHRWLGQIQAIGVAGGENISIDRVWIESLDDYAGVLRASASTVQLEPFSLRDEFNQSAGGLAAKTLPVGGTWTGTGDADDIQVSSGLHKVYRQKVDDGSATGGRYAIAGTTIFTDYRASVDVYMESIGGDEHAMALLARYVDTSNWLMARVYISSLGGPAVASVDVIKRVGGSVTTLSTQPVSALQFFEAFGSTGETLALTVFADGGWTVTLNGTDLDSGSDTDLATGGTLEDGKGGLYDAGWGGSGGVSTRVYDNFTARVPLADAVLYDSLSAEIGTDGAYREDSAGDAHGPVSWVTGALPRLPSSGMEQRPVELLVKPTRGDLRELPDGGLDGFAAQVFYRPCFLSPPAAT